MPELPEVETMVRGIRPSIEGRTLVSVRGCGCLCRPILLEPNLRRMAKLAVGRRVTAVRRRAKRVVFDLEGGSAFVIEPRMTGLMLVQDPPNTTHLRVEWQFRTPQGRPSSVWFWDQRGLGTVRLLSPTELETTLGSQRLGKDALEMEPADWKLVCSLTKRPIKVALLDQRLVAGIGNLYASEILHRARIHPERPTSSLRSREIARLSEAVREILEEAIRYEGSTLSDGTYRNALNEAGSYQNAHRVYDRHDERCLRCTRGTIVRIVQAQRSTFFCAKCQK